MGADDLTVVIVPGLRDHVVDHWQTLLARRLPRSVTVEPLVHDKLSRTARVEALERTLRGVAGPALLVAHSAGVITVAHWAAAAVADRAVRGRVTAPGGAVHDIRGALLATPADLEEPLPAGYPARADLQAHGWLPIPRGPLPFRAVVAASRNDPLARLERVRGFAHDWDAACEDIGEVGHLNPVAGYGEWPQALHWIAQLSKPARAQ